MTGSGGLMRPEPVQLGGLRTALATNSLVNLAGPLGVGKSWLARQLDPAVTVDLCRPTACAVMRRALADPADGPLVVDSADGPTELAALRDLLALAPAGHPPVLVVSRLPVLSRPGWIGSGVVTITASPVPDSAIATLATTAQITDPDDLALVVRLAAGVPLLAEAACRAVHGGASAATPGAVADHMTIEILDRLARELPGRRWQHALRLLATVGAGDEKLLASRPDLFSAVAGLSVVTRTELGLTVLDPYREVMELAYRWRRPTAHSQLRDRASAYRIGQLSRVTSPDRRLRVVENALFLADDPVVRQRVRPLAPSPVPICRAEPDDADDIGRLMRRWAVHSGFDRRRADRMADRWLGDGTADFHLTRDGDGRPTGLANLTPITAHTVSGMEPLLQQYADGLLDSERPGGLFVGAAFCPDPATRAQIFRHILSRGVASGRLVVSTASPDYQRLLRGLRFHRHGSIHDDVYGCGHPPQVYSNDMSPEGLPSWLRRLTGEGPSAGAVGCVSPRQIAEALRQIRDPEALASSPLLTSPQVPTAAALRGWLHHAVRRLADSTAPADAEAGRILLAYYLERTGDHQQIARRMHLSRATYFRRLQHGVAALRHHFATVESPTPLPQ